MELSTAIETRRSIRRYQNKPVSNETINQLLEAAILAPSASNTQPWVFAVIQDTELLKNYSDRSKTLMLNLMKESPDPHGYRAGLSKPEFNIFYNAGTLVVIYAKPGNFSVSDCNMAAYNIMLTAHEMGLGTCWIGFSIPFLNSKELKEELNIPYEYTAAAALIVGYPDMAPLKTFRKAPEILVWK